MSQALLQGCLVGPQAGFSGRYVNSGVICAGSLCSLCTHPQCAVCRRVSPRPHLQQSPASFSGCTHSFQSCRQQSRRQRSMSLTVSFSKPRLIATACRQLTLSRTLASHARLAFLIVHCAVDSKRSHKKSEGTDCGKT